MTKKTTNKNQELIPINKQTIDNIETLTCDGRSLHEFLEVGRDYSTWMKERIEKYGFVEGSDFLLTKSGEQKGRGGHNRIEYTLTVDMAKQIAMVENNDKGVAIRRYFIDCEKIAKEVVRRGIPKLDSPITTDQRKRISAAVAIMSQKSHYTRQECWQLLHAKFDVVSVADITTSQYPAVADWLDTWAKEAARPISSPEITEYEQSVLDSFRKLDPITKSAMMLLANKAAGGN